jgi:hypothetical protein
MSTLSFNFPKNMSPLEIARAFTAYRIGPIAFTECALRGDQGPYIMRGTNTFQIDNTNDYWMSFEGNRATINCREQYQEKVISAMVQLFKLQHLIE